MIPSLVAADLKQAVTEFLTTTFAVGDDDTREELTRFLGGTSEQEPGIFRGPFVRVRAPFRAVEDDWKSPLEWFPEEFRPYLHQDRAHRRLSSTGPGPLPTLVTTGTGSGKTECFLHPILDHCRRHQGEPGIKAIILYPMNALATDQAGRIAEVIAGDERLAGITAGLYLGEGGEDHFQSQGLMTEKSVITDRSAMRRLPPDILLTNYRMLDFLLLRGEDRDLWEGTGSDSLRYLVLDEFHTYDGAQGTDVAMLLRRLGVRLGLSQPGRPLGGVAPVATSATLGSGVDSESMRDFAARVFGTPFEPDSVIDEDRETADECLAPINYESRIPQIDDLPALEGMTDLNPLAVQFIGREPEDEVELGQALLEHPLTWTVFEELSGEPRPIGEALERIVRQTREWGQDLRTRREEVEAAVGKYLALLSVGRRPGGRPLLTIEVQLWIREVSRLLRAVGGEPAFHWSDDSGSPLLETSVEITEENTEAVASPHELPSEVDAREYAPAIYCRTCGRTGWMAKISEFDGSIAFKAKEVYADSPSKSPRLRALIAADPGEEGVLYLDPGSGQLEGETAPGRVPVLATPNEDAARRNECPSCAGRDDIVFIGSRVASLASVTITQLFASDFASTPRLLAFTDSVQDASHRASFFNARTFRFNLRTALAQAAIGANGGVPLKDFGARLIEFAESADTEAEGRRRIHDLVPIDLLDHPEIKALWNGEKAPTGKARDMLVKRIELEAHLEFGLRARLGRTLELSGSSTASVSVDDMERLVDLVAEVVEETGGQLDPDTEVGDVDSDLTGQPNHRTYIHGLLERLRLQGAINHSWLKRYVETGGRRWQIWGGRQEGMAAFPTGQLAPRFLWDGESSKDFDLIASSQGSVNWLTNWATRCLRAESEHARLINHKVLGLLAEEGIVERMLTDSNVAVYSLDPSRILVHDVTEPEHRPLCCNVCSGRFAVPVGDPDHWTGSPCLRFRCVGSYQEDLENTGSYYRDLYRRGDRPRIVAAEHTGSLIRSERERLEEQFKAGDSPGDPNVLSCTPTLEMGVDIGDLDSVMLTSVPRNPASYLQRVGRAGRRSGNSFISTFVPARSRGLHFLEQPEELIDGELTSPDCWLDAIEILRRQYFAFLMDRAAAGAISAPDCPHQMNLVAKSLDKEGGYLQALLSEHDKDPEPYAMEFLDQFGANVTEKTRLRLVQYAANGLRSRVEEAIRGWAERHNTLVRRRNRLSERVKGQKDKGHLTEDQELDLKEMDGELKAMVRALQSMRAEYSLTGLERIGLLPNYNLSDEGISFAGTAWSRSRQPGSDDSDAFEFSAEDVEARRSAELGIRELAPGSSYYTAGKRFRIDAIEFSGGPSQNVRQIRVCPECSFVGQENITSCPRCNTSKIADSSCRHEAVELSSVSSLERAEDARVEDRSDERHSTPFDIVTTVDVDPTAITGAWKLPDEDRPFGVERANATVNFLNLGRSDRSGEEVFVEGESRSAARFETCLHCGVVQGAKEESNVPDIGQHRGWCVVKTGKKQSTKKLILTHTLDTEVVRMILPMADFEVKERLASFKAALMLGLKLNLGGSPDHLRVLVSSAPVQDGAEDGNRRRFLVIRDTVPGGTGYLERLTDFEELGDILRGARDLIYRCQCREEGRKACYRCLLSEADYGEEEVVSRGLAIELLDELLQHWDAEGPSAGPQKVPTIADLPIGNVEESELERRLRLAILAWGSKTPGASIREIPGKGNFREMELRVPEGGVSHYITLSETEQAKHPRLRYRIREQHPLKSSPATLPDFLISRLDGTSPDVAIYSDGFKYHAHPDARHVLADDARKRAGARAFGIRVWSMDWEDVVEFETAIGADTPVPPPKRSVLQGDRLSTARKVQHQRGGAFDLDRANDNPLSQLLEYLCNPDGEEWRRLARSAVAGLVAGGPKSEKGGSLIFDVRGTAGVDVKAVLDLQGPTGAKAENWSVRATLDDSKEGVSEEGHKARWREWLWWGNLLQFLDGDGCQQLITTSSIQSEDEELFTELPAAFVEDSGEAELGGKAIEEIELAAPECQELLLDAIKAGAPLPEVGYEVGETGVMVEAAWPEQQVGVIVEPQTSPDGWNALTASEWNVDKLLEELKGSAS